MKQKCSLSGFTLNTNADQKEFVRFLKGLDGMISCSNSIAHLAGSKGLPTFLIFPDRGINQWHLRDNNENSLWYPKTTVHLIPKRSDENLLKAFEEAKLWFKNIK